MKQAWYTVRAVVLWAMSMVHFAVVCAGLMLAALFLDPRRHDWPQRMFFRNVLRLLGVGFRVHRAAGFDPQRTSIFIANHVNLFDAFVIYSAIPQFVRGLELESHFKIPFYGWMMKRFGNIPVPMGRSPAALKKMYRRVKAALDDGISVVVFAEGGRTPDGHVGRFRDGAFRMAVEFGYPVVPLSIVGSYEFNRKGDWMIYPSTITVHLHDTIDTTQLGKADMAALRDRVRQIVAAPVDEHIRRQRERGHRAFASEPAVRSPG
jgi:1-acyl-sn-glycerol-3-phosphate acyltransferase